MTYRGVSNSTRGKYLCGTDISESPIETGPDIVLSTLWSFPSNWPLKLLKRPAFDIAD